MRLLQRKVLTLTLVLAAQQPVRSQVYQELHAFAGGGDGAFPNGALIQGADGNFYGTTQGGGLPADYGTIFKMTADGVLTTVAWFDETNTGEWPVGALIQATDGSFYGTTYTRDLFRVTPQGNLTKLLSLGGNPVGMFPDSCELVEGLDGYLYGANAGKGIAFRTSLDGTVFDSWHPCGNASGSLIQGTDGNFYGMTSGGDNCQGYYGFGSVYKLTPKGEVTTLITLGYVGGRLLQASDGNLYGPGFRLTPTGALQAFGTNLYAADGLIEANDGNFYGVTLEGGTNNNGTVFKLSRQGQASTLVSFTYESGSYPGSEPSDHLVQGRDGNLYGICHLGGSKGFGNVFRLIMPGPLLSCTQTNSQLYLSWRTNYVGYAVQLSQDLENWTNWTNWTNSAAISGGQFIVTNSISANAGFYRLMRQ